MHVSAIKIYAHVYRECQQTNGLRVSVWVRSYWRKKHKNTNKASACLAYLANKTKRSDQNNTELRAATVSCPDIFTRSLGVAGRLAVEPHAFCTFYFALVSPQKSSLQNPSLLLLLSLRLSLLLRLLCHCCSVFAFVLPTDFPNFERFFRDCAAFYRYTRHSSARKFQLLFSNFAICVWKSLHYFGFYFLSSRQCDQMPNALQHPMLST